MHFAARSALAASLLFLPVLGAGGAAAAPSASLRMEPASVLQYESFMVALVIANPDADAYADVDVALTVGGSGRADTLTAPGTPLTVAPGTTVTVYWTMQAEEPGPLSLAAAIQGSRAAGPLTLAAATAGAILLKTDGVTVYPVPATGDSVTVACFLPAGADVLTVDAFNGSFERAYHGEWTALAAGRPAVEIGGLREWAPGVYLLRVRARQGDCATLAFPVARVVVAR